MNFSNHTPLVEGERWVRGGRVGGMGVIGENTVPDNSNNSPPLKNNI
jgi:hypothetical protein